MPSMQKARAQSYFVLQLSGKTETTFRLGCEVCGIHRSEASEQGRIRATIGFLLIHHSPRG